MKEGLECSVSLTRGFLSCGASAFGPQTKSSAPGRLWGLSPQEPGSVVLQ